MMRVNEQALAIMQCNGMLIVILLLETDVCMLSFTNYIDRKHSFFKSFMRNILTYFVSVLTKCLFK